MPGQVSVPIRDRDMTQAVDPSVGEVVEPGTSAISFNRRLIGGVLWIQDHWIDTESTAKAKSESRKIL